jgi:hypothetical protein
MFFANHQPNEISASVFASIGFYSTSQDFYTSEVCSLLFICPLFICLLLFYELTVFIDCQYGR